MTADVSAARQWLDVIAADHHPALSDPERCWTDECRWPCDAHRLIGAVRSVLAYADLLARTSGQRPEVLAVDVVHTIRAAVAAASEEGRDA